MTGDESRERALARALRPRRSCTDAELAAMLRRAADLFDGDHADRLRARAAELDRKETP